MSFPIGSKICFSPGPVFTRLPFRVHLNEPYFIACSNIPAVAAFNRASL